MREIGLETVALWKQFLETRMNEIMPYYVQLANAQISMADAFITKNLKETIKREGTENSDKNTKGKSNGSEETNDTHNISGEKYQEGSDTTKDTIEGSSEKDVSTTDHTVNDQTVNNETNGKKLISDTPQDGLEAVINGTYLSNAEIDNSHTGESSNQESNSTGTGKEIITNNQTRDGEGTNKNYEKSSNSNIGNVTKTNTNDSTVDELLNKDYNENVSRET